eukprot:Phypoly_transcript_07646.p1 GENE.Phypoly_transcript_07646~~Phypoly_transcript_07646.p1  ORF type:complete len:406 (+),score=46.82 Phypoly_transcript_07646:315-1532(+)
MSVSSRRTASVIISGSSNLPPDKLNTLSSSLNSLLQLIVNVYNVCEDSSMSQEEKFNKIADFRSVDTAIDQLIFCIGEEMRICSDVIRNSMEHKYHEVTRHTAELKQLLSQYSAESANRLQTAKAVFEGLLQIVNGAIDLLKLADQHFVERLVNEANSTLVYLKMVRDAINMNELVLATQDYTTTSVNLAKRLTKRIDSGVLPPEPQQNAQQALEILKNESANVVNVKRNQLSFPGNDMHAVALDSAVQTIATAVSIVLEVARADPKFAVDFQVDYVDDEFGLLLAKLVDAVDSCDNAMMVNMLGQIIRAVSNRSIDSGLPQDDPKIRKVKNDLIETRDLSQQNVQLREAGVSTSLITTANRNMDAAIKNLRQSYHAISSNKIADRSDLREAARQIIANLDKLVV